MDFAIECRNLSKSFVSYKKAPGLWGSFKSFISREQIAKFAVKDFSFQLPKGKIIGLLGPNGAGKTTLMKMFTGIVVPSSGECLVLGHKPSERKKEFRQQIALVMGQKSQLWWDLPAMDSFELLQKYYEIPRAHFQKKYKNLASLLAVDHLLHIHMRKLSLGERMKMELMASLLHSPEIIFLDEPTIGLDLISQERIREFLLEYHREHQTTIILTSHYMEDVEALCSELLLISQGQKTYEGSLTQFQDLLGSEKSLVLWFEEAMQEVPEVQAFKPEWNPSREKLSLSIPQEKLKEVATMLLDKYPIRDFATEKSPIEKVMKEVMRSPELLNFPKT